MSKSDAELAKWAVIGLGIIVAYELFQQVVNVGTGAANSLEQGIGNAACSIWPLSLTQSCQNWNGQ
jgi:hypothetical protein